MDPQRSTNLRSHPTQVLAWTLAVGLLLSVALGSASASATTLVEAGLPELYERAELVIEGRVLSSAVLETPVQPRVFTEWQVSVDKVWKGTPDGVISVRHPGGKVARGELVIEGMPRLEVGESDLLFLERLPGPGEAPRYIVLGMWQGRFVRSSDGLQWSRTASATQMVSPGRWCTGGEGQTAFSVAELRRWLEGMGEAAGDKGVSP